MTKREEFNAYLKEIRLGDRLEFLFRITGIKWLVKKINPKCNCEHRKQKLNNLKINRR